MANPTIKTIAQEAGVSIATVSKALNDKPDISEQEKKRIRAIAEKQGYVLNRNARQLAIGHSNAVGVLLPDISDANVAQIYRAISNRVNRADYSIYLNDTAGSKKNEALMALQMLQKRVGALIVLPIEHEVDHILAAVKGQFPTIFVGGTVPLSAENAVECDEYKGGFLAARHLFHAGHRHCAVLTTGVAGSTHHERMRGFVAYMQEKRCTVKVYRTDSPLEGEALGVHLAGQMLQDQTICSAVFATGDAMAFGAMSVFKNYGIKIPEDISVVGYGDTPCASLELINLTTVCLPKHELGIVAGDMALDLINASQEIVHRIKLEPHIVRRNTVKKRQ